MRIAVIGAGAVGGTIAALLDRAGHDVEVTARGSHAEAIERNGLRLSGAWGDHIAAVLVGPELIRAADLVIVATKAQDAAAAISSNQRAIGRTPILVIQNGLEGISTATRVAPRSDVIGALGLFAASLATPGHVTVTAPGLTVLGVADPENDLPARYVAGIVGAVMPVEIVGDFRGAQWTKLVINQINALPAITGLSAQEVIAMPVLRRIMTEGMREAVLVALRSGVRFASVQGLSHRRLRLFAALPVGVAGFLPRELARRMGRVPNPGSTLQSIRRGQASEVDYLNGAIVHAADAAATAAPVNAFLLELVHEVEASGSFIPVASVVDRFRL